MIKNKIKMIDVFKQLLLNPQFYCVKKVTYSKEKAIDFSQQDMF